MKPLAPVAVIVALSACGSGSSGSSGHIDETGSSDTVVQTYARSFHFASPFACDPFVLQRYVDTTNDSAEYDARASSGSDTVIEQIYSLSPKDPYPVQLEVTYTSASSGKTAALWTIALGPHDAELRDGGDSVVLTVHGYDGATPSAVPGPGRVDAPPDVVSDAASLERCMLPVQTALGFVPSFFQNRQETATSGDVVGGSPDVPAIVPTWDGARTILGAYLAAAVCFESSDGATWRWACACPAAHENTLLGADLEAVCGGRIAAPPAGGWWKEVQP